MTDAAPNPTAAPSTPDPVTVPSLRTRKRRNGAAPIVMVTATGDESDKIVALELGVDDYLSKPFSLHELDLRVERSLGRFYAAKNGEAQ